MNRILVVDDQEIIRSMLSRYLKKRGYKVEIAGSADTALEKLRGSTFELAVVDIQMPGKDGIELLQQITREHPDTAVVMVSGVNEVETVLETVKMGAYDYITKPFSLNVVESCLRRVLEKRNLIIENRNYQKNLEKQVRKRTKELEETLHKIEFSYDATIKALGAALDLRDSETEDHSLRVAGFVLKLAKTMGIEDGTALRDIEWGAYLHDIGKIGIPDAILLKPGKLTEEERTVIKYHPALGHKLLSNIQFLKGASELVLSHHEWYDGSGYPRGLKGYDIPVSARLFSVADTVDAMTRDRPYRKALPIRIVGKELSKLSGIQYDPEIVDVFFNMPENEWAGAGQLESA